MKVAGLHKYCEDPTTEIICVGYAFDDEVPVVCRPHHLPAHVKSHIHRGGPIVAHNATFEFHVWNAMARNSHKTFLPMDWTQLNCTMARAYAMGLPGSLANAAAAVGLDTRKDMAGQRLMLQMSKPRRTADGSVVWWEEDEQLQRLFEYCGQDIAVTQALDKRLLNLNPAERDVWLTDFHINNHGIQVDVESAERALRIVETEQKRLNDEMRAVTGNAVCTYTAAAQLKDWLESVGVSTEGVAKYDVTELLNRTDLSAPVRRALQIRQEGSKSSTAKLKSILNRACSDERVRGGYQYHGATTGRWAARGVQTQNLPKPRVEQRAIDETFAYLSGSNWVPKELADSPIQIISDCLRGFFIAAPGMELFTADFAAIEARVLAWLAGQEDVLEEFRGRGKIYEKAASSIYQVPVDSVTKEQRQIGKVAVLALGYQGGVNAFQAMAKGYGVRVAKDTARALWWAATDDRKDRARWGWEERGKKSGIPKDEWVGCELIKLAWREANPKIVDYWARIESAAVEATRFKGRKCMVGENPDITFVFKGSFLFCRLPSGRVMSYPYPEVKQTRTPWDSERPLLHYKTEYQHQWTTQTAYGGFLVENITQAVARDILADTMTRLSDSAYHIVLHAHDEVVCEVPEGATHFDAFLKLVAKVPQWATGLPIHVEGWRGKRYRK